jgi:hypothetical protein
MGSYSAGGGYSAHRAKSRLHVLQVTMSCSYSNLSTNAVLPTMALTTQGLKIIKYRGREKLQNAAKFKYSKTHLRCPQLRCSPA